MRTRLLKILSQIIACAVIVADLIVMVGRKGLSSDLDFGAGAYFYTDIPGFERMFYITEKSSDTSDLIIWGVFILWGIIIAVLLQILNRLVSRGKNDE